MLWNELKPDSRMIHALEHAGIRPESGQDPKRRWSEKFADACAVAVANSVRSHPSLKKKRILPFSLEAGVEPLTPLSGATRKRIDVTVADPLMGLEIGISLKGLNFRDGQSGYYDKNLTGRMYELGDEVRLVHEHLPHAFMVGVFFLPLESTVDKMNGNSSFANAVSKLRDRSGRLDPALHAHASRCDKSYVGLYTHSDNELGLKPGIVRFHDTSQMPPRRGRPVVENTLTLEQMVGDIVAKATHVSDFQWSEPEPE